MGDGWRRGQERGLLAGISDGERGKAELVEDAGAAVANSAVRAWMVVPMPIGGHSGDWQKNTHDQQAKKP